ncbi:MAG: F0F1 ATP synthase subunit gamma [Alphaproteobacteria bacterium]|nr:F0F1 ATP synthase subunit gamma [Alphaproteobacteria bacterium]MCY4229609.1 F0F1 ATP synthase subunit gamma [Alphaproteobacteria bacterium]MCY4318499.1 F0F1 ATP synthase subunit gamma [Alphaproteobacteria bacterium]
MPSLKDLRNRISSVRATQKITSAMKMVAAAKLRRAQEAAEAARPYAERMERMLGSLGGSLAGSAGAPKLLAGSGEDQVHLLVVATADRGLCGGFNGGIVRRARELVDELESAGKTVRLLCVGRKGRDQLRRLHGAKIVDVIEGVGRRSVEFAEADTIAERVRTMFDEGEFDVCSLVYARFKSAISNEVTVQQLVPAPLPERDEDAASEGASAVYIYEPDEEAILEDLLPRNVSVQIYRALLENAASEHGARMAAMDNATRNAGEMIARLTLQYNRTRQAMITKELIEIISGAEAV